MTTTDTTPKPLSTILFEASDWLDKVGWDRGSAHLNGGERGRGVCLLGAVRLAETDGEASGYPTVERQIDDLFRELHPGLGRGVIQWNDSPRYGAKNKRAVQRKLRRMARRAAKQEKANA